MEYIVIEKNGEKITTRMLQDKLLIILKEVDRVCKKNNIDYFVSDGTCLGAIRHKGFIPWDDDVDIGMSRKEYKKFIKALKKDLSSDFVFHCYETNKKYLVTWPAMKIRMKNTYIKEKNIFEQNKCKDCDGIFIDVFIYDRESNHFLLDFPLRFLNIILGGIILVLEMIHINPIPLKEIYKFNAGLYGSLCKKSKYFGDEITWITNPIHPARVKYTDVYPTIRVPFEDTYLPVPNNYHNYLVAKYGEDYMVYIKESKRVCTHTKDLNLNSDKI